MLLCNNTAIPALCRIICMADRRAVLRCAAPPFIMATMSDADELARRFLAVWADYLTALASNPQNAEIWRRWLDLAVPATAADGDGGGPVAGAGPAAGAAAAAGALGEHGDAVAELTRRIAALEERLAGL